MPAALTCGHVFCKECIDEATTAGRRQGRTRCPTCRAEYVGSPIKLFMSESRERPQPPREKTWAEATIPLPFFAELHLKNLREDLATTQSVLETTQRQLELSLAEKRQLLAQNRRVIAERTTAHQAREQLVEECKVLKAEKTLYLEAGRGLEASVAVLHDQSAEMRQELDNAVDTIRQLKARLERQDQREGPATNPDRDRRSKMKVASEFDDASSPSSSSGKSQQLSPSQLPVHDHLPPLPPSMSLDEILVGGLKKYMPARQRPGANHS